MRLTIDGGQEDITVSGDDKVQVLSVSQGAKLTVENLTIASGSAASGGGIENRGSTLTVTDSTFSNNSAVGTNSSGIIDCENACYGGGIENDGGTLTVTGSTFSGNESDAEGGGIANTNGTLTVTNSTFSGNSAGFVGGGIGNAIRNTATLSNTVLAGSQGGNCGLGTFIDGGYNISSDASCAFTDSTSKNSTEPKLDPNALQNNGGPTQTVALQPTSPAVNAIPPSIHGCGTTITTDQRGVSRPQGPACDVGAFELTKASPPDKDKKEQHKKKHKKKHRKKHKGGGGGGGISKG